MIAKFTIQEEPIEVLFCSHDRNEVIAVQFKIQVLGGDNTPWNFHQTGSPKKQGGNAPKHL